MLNALKNKLKNRADSEHEQAAIRVIITAIVSIYLSATFLYESRPGDESFALVLTIVIYSLISILIFWAITVHPVVSPLRRLLGIIGDNTATTIAMYLTGETGAPLFSIYLWVAFGNGFRFGGKYLTVSSMLAFTGFGAVYLTTGYWETQRIMGAGILIAIIVLPLYVIILVKKLMVALKKTEEANRAKSQFLANMSHEIRTPMNGVLGMIDLLLKTPLSDRQFKYAETVRRSAMTLLDIINSILDFSKVEAGKLDIDITTFDLQATVRETLESFGEIARKKGLKFKSSISPDTPALLHGSDLRIRQVLVNLVGNALKFTEHGTVDVNISLYEAGDDIVWLTIAVRDQGIGIAREDHGRIFEAFSQADGSSARRYGGTGLGLAISRQLALMMGGDITVDSAPGQGSTFTFTAKLKKPTSEEIEAALAAGAAGTLADKDKEARFPLLHCRILLAEDNPVNREVAVSMLESFGAAVHVVINGFEAIDASLSGAYDLILMDCQMPGMDGYKAAAKIRSADEKMKNIPIIALTAHTMEGDREKCLAAGMNDFIAKPFKERELYDTISRWLSGKALHETAHSGRAADEKTGAQIRRILVIDDDETILDVTRQMLEFLGCEVICAMNFTGLIEEYEKEAAGGRQFDLVFMDINIAGNTDGIESTRTLVKKFPEARVIATSGQLNHDAMTNFAGYGFCAALPKPYTLDELGRILKLIPSP